ncbi:sensor domain-containing diguanylate cyclase [Paucibacter sp. XJ19-41]|uniref:sensor domain-containing diguanylate cyclase n=1 Tax=Paucibacter sp. XJ19-41 TaxID=2927824 RepID=UPI00234A89D8|nr:diguanylate cyclase [Paucibacter sp. XJ19-41]MDC6167982.1 diguanylate cyclase [Paucibacter sp. XJ19-41]
MRNKSSETAMVAAIVLLGLLLTGVVVLRLHASERQRVETEAQLSAGEISNGIQRRLNAHAEVLHGLAGLFNTRTSLIDRAAFRSYVERWRPHVRLPAVQAVQFVRLVTQAELADFERGLRSDPLLPAALRQDLRLRPAADEPVHYLIDYTEPVAGNERALGFDLANLPSHKRALEQGRDSGRLVATERVRLIQDPSGAAAFVLRLPIYRSGSEPADTQQRREALRGFVAVVYRVGNLLDGLLDDSVTARLRIVIHDAGLDDGPVEEWSPTPANLMYDSDSALGDSAQAIARPESLRRVLEVGGRTWHVYLVPKNVGGGAGMLALALVGLGGLTITVLTVSLARAWARQRRTALSLGALSAEQMAVFDNALTGIVHVRGARLYRCNRRFADILGYEIEALAGLPASQLYPSAEAYQQIETQVRERRHSGQPLDFELALRAKDGRQVWCAMHGKLLPGDERRGSIWVIEELTEQRAAAERLQAQRLATERANEELQQGMQQVSAQKRLVELLGTMSSTLQSCHDADEVAEVVARGFPALEPGCGGAFYLLDPVSGCLQLRRHWGEQGRASVDQFAPHDCWGLRRSKPYAAEGLALRCTHHGAGGTGTLCLPLLAMNELVGLLCLEAGDELLGPDAPLRLVAVAAAEQVAVTLVNLRMRERLRDQALRDKLTGLRNRRFLDESLPRELARARREGGSLALMLIDVDHFKRFNDQHGHEAGDQVLAAVGRCLSAQTRQEDLACRYGGEEFVVVLPRADLASAAARAEALRAAIAALPLLVGAQQLQVTASFGLAAYPGHGPDAAQLLAAADAALYEAKRAGRNRLQLAAA